MEVNIMVANGKLYTTVMEKLHFEPRLDAANITVAIQGNHDIVVLDVSLSTKKGPLICTKKGPLISKIFSSQ